MTAELEMKAAQNHSMVEEPLPCFSNKTYRSEAHILFFFYLGHIPTFLDIHLSNLLQEAKKEATERSDGI
jgi:hypothetical protein